MWTLPRAWLPGQRKTQRSSGLSDAPIRWLVDDCVKFVEREIRRGNHYDGIIMDPPSYGRGPKGEIWKIEESHLSASSNCATQLLSDDPLFFLINSYTTGLQPAVLTYMMQTAITPKFGGHCRSIRKSDCPLQTTDWCCPAAHPDAGANNRMHALRAFYCHE